MPKRLRNGHQKGADSRISNGLNSADKAFSDIEAEILALGGNREDYDLVVDIPSDSEYENNETQSAPAKSLQKELRRLLQDQDSENTAHEDLDQISPTNGPAKIDQEIETVESRRARTRLPSLSEWFSIELPPLRAPLQEEPLSSGLAGRLYEYAKTLLEAENKAYNGQKRSATSAHQFYSTIMTSGTLSDKISALTLSIQESPLHNVKALESLLALARKRSRSQAVDVLGALKDLFAVGTLLPSDRKLRYFSQQPGLSTAWNSSGAEWTPSKPLPKPLKEIHLIAWSYEDWLKSAYFEVIKIIETWCNDEVVFARSKAVDYVFQLLREKPEQEANLLRLLVNKLGDSDKKIASKASYNLLQLQMPHPLMKSTIISAIESDLLFRPNQSLHAKYYATITLNQTPLSAKQESVTKQLLEIYFSLFIQLLAKPVPTAKDSIDFNKKGEIQGGGGRKGRKARKKQAVNVGVRTTEDQLREKILSAVLTGVNRAIPYANVNDGSFEKHMDTLFKVTHSSNLNTSIQALILVQQLVGLHQGTADRFYRTLYESLLDPRLLTTSKQTLYLNLLFKALRSDLNTKRVKAFIKRLFQVAPMHQAPFACASIYLVRELETIFPDLKPFLDQLEEAESDVEETFHDVPEDDDAWNQELTSRQETDGVVSKSARMQSLYDGRKRDPQHSNADKSCFWELTPLLKYYHPSVSLFATRLEHHEILPPKPDLTSNTLSHFLDRFVYRNPKSKSTARGTSIMQPLAAGDSSGLLITTHPRKPAPAPVNTEFSSNVDLGEVAADEVFFHKYFSTTSKGKQQAKKKKEKRKRQADEHSEAEEDEEEIWQALVNSRPELEGNSDDEGSELDDMASVADYSDVASSTEDRGQSLENDDAQQLDLEDGEEALIGSDGEVPDNLDKAFEEEAEFGDSSEAPILGIKQHKQQRRRKRLKLKNLPTFASAEDYAKMLDEES
ncbi:MAG: hypothetical protein Q9191_003307 [Dirinaria sp. TL-2023a]